MSVFLLTNTGLSYLTKDAFGGIMVDFWCLFEQQQRKYLEKCASRKPKRFLISMTTVTGCLRVAGNYVQKTTVNFGVHTYVCKSYAYHFEI